MFQGVGIDRMLFDEALALVPRVAVPPCGTRGDGRDVISESDFMEERRHLHHPPWEETKQSFDSSRRVLVNDLQRMCCCGATPTPETCRGEETSTVQVILIVYCG